MQLARLLRVLESSGAGVLQCRSPPVQESSGAGVLSRPDGRPLCVRGNAIEAGFAMFVSSASVPSSSPGEGGVPFPVTSGERGWSYLTSARPRSGSFPAPVTTASGSSPAPLGAARCVPGPRVCSPPAGAAAPTPRVRIHKQRGSPHGPPLFNTRPHRAPPAPPGASTADSEATCFASRTTTFQHTLPPRPPRRPPAPPLRI